MTDKFLLDTNHLSAAISPVSPLRERLREARRSGRVLGTCVLVLAELEAGILQTYDPDAYHRALDIVLRLVRVWPLDTSLGRVYGELFLELRAAGRVLSQVDIMLAALAREMKLTLLTADQDFVALPWLRRENWLPAAGGAVAKPK